MTKKLILASLVFALAVLPLDAQFYSQGSDPGNLRWYQLDTPTYSLVFPSGMDSLARKYASLLEAVKEPVGSGTGFIPNSSYRKRMPVVLHPYSAEANGMVTWAPRRMELFTIPDANAPIPMSNEMELSIHESRHVAQMQFGCTKPFRWANILFGELAGGALSGIYCGPAFLEGDAVLAETALSASGRGRTADFLEYYRVSSDEGKTRDFWQWRWGSQYLYTPDYYRAGYLLMAGMRTVHDVPDFTAKYFERIEKHHGFAFLNLQKTIRETTGKTLKDSFSETIDSMKKEWEEDVSSRGPFNTASAVTSDREFFTSYKNLEVVMDDVYAIRNGLSEASSLIHLLPDGKEQTVTHFSNTASRLQYDQEKTRLYWSETTPDARWELRSFSDIRYIDNNRRVHTLTRGHRYFNPAPNGQTVAVVEYPVEGGSNAVCIDADSGKEFSTVKAPDGLQLVEPVWIGNELYASGLSDGGFGIYRIHGFTCLLEPQPVKIKQLFSHEGKLFFTSDLNGVDELYSLDPDSGRLMKITNTRNGASDFRFNGSGDTLYFTVLSTGGRNISRIAVNELTPEPAGFGDRHEYAMAEKLSSTEDSNFEADEIRSEIKPYSKATRLFRFHSWAPLYVNYDAVSGQSFESISQTAGLGATAFFQNDLGTSWGSVAYHAGHSSDGWHHSGHAKFIYRGWYPVLEAGLDIGDRYSKTTTITIDEKGGTAAVTNSTGRPLVSYNLKAYIPFNFTRGGLNRGVIPQLRLSGSNDKFEGKSTIGLLASVRGYISRKIPSSGIYPRFGIGAEMGVFTRPGLSGYFCPNVYGFVYAYLPGFWKTHGIKLSATVERHLSAAPYANATASTVPRGFLQSANNAMAGYPVRSKLSFDYALPFGQLDWSALCPFFYLKNFEAFVHADLSLMNGASTVANGNLFSAGADVMLRLANFLFIPYDTRIGLSYNYNGGSLYDMVADKLPSTGHHSFELVFSIDL